MTTTADVRAEREYSNHTSQEVTGGVDGKGRAVGRKVYSFDITYRVAAPGVYGYLVSADKIGKTVFAAYIQATRDGQKFGALRHDNIFDTAEERDAWVAKKLAEGPTMPKGGK